MPYHVKLGELYQKEKIGTKVPHDAYGGRERETECIKPKYKYNNNGDEDVMMYYRKCINVVMNIQVSNFIR